MSDTNPAAEVVAEVAEEVADQATHVAEVSRGLSGHSIGLTLGGFVVGVAAGAAIGYIFASRRLETKYQLIAAEEVAVMSKHYRAKLVALESNSEKEDLAKIVQERGYATAEEAEEVKPPMAVTPPSAVVDAVTDEDDEEDDSEEEEAEFAETTEEFQARERNVFAEHSDAVRGPDDWDWHRERRKRSPVRPYVIHIEERDERDGYDGVSWTYFEEDDVLCNERDEIVDAGDRERLIGDANLERFGHGSGDPDTVYIRNDALEMIFEVNRSHRSFTQEVAGFTPEPEIRHSDRRERTRFDDE